MSIHIFLIFLPPLALILCLFYLIYIDSFNDLQSFLNLPSQIERSIWLLSILKYHYHLTSYIVKFFNVMYLILSLHPNQMLLQVLPCQNECFFDRFSVLLFEEPCFSTVLFAGTQTYWRSTNIHKSPFYFLLLIPSPPTYPLILPSITPFVK